MNFALLITVLLTAITLVVAAYVVAKLIGPRSYAKVKGEPYESGTRQLMATYDGGFLSLRHLVPHV